MSNRPKYYKTKKEVETEKRIDKFITQLNKTQENGNDKTTK
jgi:hypothetical protein